MTAESMDTPDDFSQATRALTAVRLDQAPPLGTPGAWERTRDELIDSGLDGATVMAAEQAVIRARATDRRFVHTLMVRGRVAPSELASADVEPAMLVGILQQHIAGMQGPDGEREVLAGSMRVSLADHWRTYISSAYQDLAPCLDNDAQRDNFRVRCEERLRALGVEDPAPFLDGPTTDIDW